jgi:hypothetical protein
MEQGSIGTTEGLLIRIGELLDLPQDWYRANSVGSSTMHPHPQLPVLAGWVGVPLVSEFKETPLIASNPSRSTLVPALATMPSMLAVPVLPMMASALIPFGSLLLVDPEGRILEGKLVLARPSLGQESVPCRVSTDAGALVLVPLSSGEAFTLLGAVIDGLIVGVDQSAPPRRLQCLFDPDGL